MPDPIESLIANWHKDNPVVQGPAREGIQTDSPIQRLIHQMLLSNENKPFVQRILNQDTRSVTMPDGRPASHRMAYAGVDDGAIAYPEVQDIAGQLSLLNSDEASRSAMDARNAIFFKEPALAKFFTENYKSVNPKFGGY